ncbi:MAG: THO complex subunit 2, partial [Pleopsidium flavum]
MAPGGGGKRKRGDRTYSQDSSNDGSRPSPHRPGNLSLAHQMHQQQGQGRDQPEHRGRGGRRASRGGRGGAQLRSPISASNTTPISAKSSPAAPNAMSPPVSASYRQNDPKQTPPTRQSPVTTNSVQQPPEPLRQASPPYDYEFLRENNVGSWKSSGRSVVINLGVYARRTEDSMTLGSILQELVRSGLNARIDPTDAGATIKDILGETTASEPNTIANRTAMHSATFDPQSFFLDCLSILTDADISNPSLRSIVLSTGVSPILMRQELESSLLQSLGLIRDTFGRMGIRKQTNLLYRQSNYNLLREETEGYSKLVTELFSTSGNEPPTSEVVEDTFERVKAMIGAFDLDVGRVLDVTLDVFAAVLVKQYRFFVRYLRASSWWPENKELNGVQLPNQAYDTLPKWALPGSSGWTTSEEDKDEMFDYKEQRDKAFWERVREVGMSAFFEIGAGRVTQDASKEAALNQGHEDSAELDQHRKWIEATGTLPPIGNRVAAQLLGFKLRFYASSARELNDILPVNLIYLAALLIKIGFISL